MASQFGVESRLRRGTSGLEFSPARRRRPIRSRRLRLRRLLWLIALSLGLILAGEILAAAFTSPRFAIQEVQIKGIDRFSLPLLVQETPPSIGANLFSFPTRRIARRLQSLAFIAEVKVKRKPPGTLLIFVKQRRPVGWLRQPWGVVLVDETAVAFVHPGPVPEGVPELRGLALSPRAIGERISGTKAFLLRKGLCALAQNPELKVNLLAVDERGWLTAHLCSGMELRLGPAKELERKLNLARVALSQLGKAAAFEYLDLSTPEAAVWKPRQGRQQDQSKDLRQYRREALS